MNQRAQTQAWMLLVEVPLSKSVCSEVDPAVCEPSTVAGLQDDEETVLEDFLSLIPKPVLKITLTTLCQPFPQFLFEDKSPFHL